MVRRREVEGRSELDDAGRPFPLLHMRLPVPNQVLQQTGEDATGVQRRAD
jgi:hypothetical protein